MGTLNPGEGATITVTVMAPWMAPCQITTITETAVIDPNHNISESDETNNSTTETTVVTGPGRTPVPFPAPTPTPIPTPTPDRTMPSAGNHGYNTAGAGGYFNYFGAAAGDPTSPSAPQVAGRCPPAAT